MKHQIDWNKPIILSDNLTPKHIAKLTKPTPDGCSIVCFVDKPVDHNEYHTIYEEYHVFLRLDGTNPEGQQIAKNYIKEVNWTLRLIVVSTGEYCRLVANDAVTKDKERSYCVLVRSIQGHDHGIKIVDKYGRNDGGDVLIKNIDSVQEYRNHKTANSSWEDIHGTSNRSIIGDLELEEEDDEEDLEFDEKNVKEEIDGISFIPGTDEEIY